MSFSAEVKTELCQIETLPKDCRKALCYGALLFGRRFSEKEITLVTEHPGFGRLLTRQIAEECGVFAEMKTKLTRRASTPETCVVTVEGDDQRLRILGHFGHKPGELQLRIHRENLPDQESVAAFLRGVFLSCGSMIDPEKEYHLEFVVPHKKLAEDLLELLNGLEAAELQPALISRKGSYMVYLKGGDAITDLLTFMGAQSGPLELIQVRMMKDLRNDVNRRSNCETANIMKTANAAAVQCIAIERIERFLGLSQLSPELRELAELRMENPEMSLRELGENLSKPISRSGVNHRIQRLLEIADTLPELP